MVDFLSGLRGVVEGLEVGCDVRVVLERELVRLEGLLCSFPVGSEVLCLGRGVVRAVSGGERIVEFLAQSVPVGLCVGVGDGSCVRGGDFVVGDTFVVVSRVSGVEGGVALEGGRVVCLAGDCVDLVVGFLGSL